VFINSFLVVGGKVLVGSDYVAGAPISLSKAVHAREALPGAAVAQPVMSDVLDKGAAVAFAVAISPAHAMRGWDAAPAVAFEPIIDGLAPMEAEAAGFLLVGMLTSVAANGALVRVCLHLGSEDFG